MGINWDPSDDFNSGRHKQWERTPSQARANQIVNAFLVAFCFFLFYLALHWAFNDEARRECVDTQDSVACQQVGITISEQP